MSSPARVLFVAGAGTEIGKTTITAALTRRLRAEGYAVRALKPLASGVPPIGDPRFARSDTGLLLAAQGLPIDAQTVAACTPWRFMAPLAPDLAAAREGRRLKIRELVAWCRAELEHTIEAPGHSAHALSCAEEKVRRADPGYVLIEGVGGVMSPVTSDATGLEWLKVLDSPALLVSGSYLGAISHALTALETLRAHDIPVHGIVVSESLEAPTPPETVADAIARHGRIPTVVFRRDVACPDELLALLPGIHKTAPP